MLVLTVRLFRGVQTSASPPNFPVGDGPLTISATILDPSNAQFPDRFTVRVRAVTVHPDLLRGVSRACIDEIFADSGTMHGQGTWVIGLFPLSIGGGTPVPVCLENITETGPFPRSFQINWDLPAPVGRSASFPYNRYPFESMFIVTAFYPRLSLFDVSGNRIAAGPVRGVRQEISTDLPNWQVRQFISERPGFASFQVRRPEAVRFATKVIIGVILLAIASILFIASFSTSVEVAVALVLGLVGVRALLVRGDLPGFPAIERAFVWAYVAVALAVVLSRVLH